MSTASKLEVEIHREGSVSPEKRERKMTEKGLEYVLQVKRRRLDQIFRNLESKGLQMQELMENDKSYGEMTSIYKRWIQHYDEFLTLDNEFRQLLKDGEIEDNEDNWFGVRNQECSDLKKTIENWYTSHRPQQNDLPTDDDITIYSNHSSKGSHSSRQTVVSAKILQEQKKAELKVKSEILRKKRTLEEARLRLKLEEDELKLEEEIAINDAYGTVIKDIEVKSTSRSSSASCDNSTSGLMAVVRHLNKPISDLQKFSGNPLEYHKFMRQFKSKVLSNCDDVDEQLNFLEQYTTGEAHRIIVGYSYLDAVKG